MPSRQVGNLAVAVAFALFAVFLYCARDEHGAWRKDYLCLFSEEHACSTATLIDGKGDSPDSAKATLSKPTAPSKQKKRLTTPLSTEVKDPATGLTLPRTKRFSKVDLTCLGVGVRHKSLGVANVNVYSVGLYVEPKGARGSLKKYAGADPKALRKDDALFKTLGQAGGFSKYLHLVFARSVGAHKVVDALTSVKGVREEILTKFSTMMLEAVGKNVGKGESVSLGWEGKDKLVVFVRDKMVGSVVDATLPKAIFNLYLGSSPVSPYAKTAFAEGVPAFLAS